MKLFDDFTTNQQCVVSNRSQLSLLQKLSEGEGVVLPQTRALHSILVDMGYEPIEKRVYIAKTKSRHRIWIKPKNISADEAEQLVKNFHDKDANDCPF